MPITLTAFRVGHQDYQGVWQGRPNSAGGVSVQISFKNPSPKVIKYAYFSVIPYNAVNDVQSCSISGKTDALLKLTGPVNGGALSTGNYWENVWYNHSITTATMFKVRLEYMDGSWEEFNGNEITLQQSSGGCCYVATCVYGSYDCPQVWTLRRFRDDTLAETWYGRLFVRTYYAVSPTLVKWFGKTKWFQKLWKGTLDKMVRKLQAKGVKDTPYNDKIW